jgi:hypothetical protein
LDTGKSIFENLTKEVIMDKVTIVLIDHSWIEGERKGETITGIVLATVSRTPEGGSEAVPIGKKVFVPWSSTLFMIEEE